MSDNNSKADNRLVCSKCHFPLALKNLPLDQFKEIHCPRCNTAHTLDPQCSTSCLSCSKMHQKEPNPCLEEIVSIDITNNSQEKTSEISGKNVEKNDHGLEDRDLGLLAKAWQYLKKGLFQVR